MKAADFLVCKKYSYCKYVEHALYNMHWAVQRVITSALSCSILFWTTKESESYYSTGIKALEQCGVAYDPAKVQLSGAEFERALLGLVSGFRVHSL